MNQYTEEQIEKLPHLITREQACLILGLSRWTLVKIAESIPSIKITLPGMVVAKYRKKVVLQVRDGEAISGNPQPANHNAPNTARAKT